MQARHRSFAIVIAAGILCPSVAAAQTFKVSYRGETHCLTTDPGFPIQGEYRYDGSADGRPRVQLYADGRQSTFANHTKVDVPITWGIEANEDGTPRRNQTEFGATMRLFVRYDRTVGPLQEGNWDIFELAISFKQKKAFVLGERVMPYSGGSQLTGTRTPCAASTKTLVAEEKDVGASGVAGTAGASSAAPDARSSGQSVKEAVKQDLSQKLLEAGAKSGNPRDIRTATQVAKGLEIASAYSAERAEKREYEASVALAKEARAQRLASGKPDVVGFEAPIRPSSTDVLVPEIQLRVLDYGFNTDWYKVGKPNRGGDDVKRFWQKEPRALAGTGVGGMAKNLEFASGAAQWTMTFVIKMKVTLNGAEQIPIVCDHYAPSGDLMISSQENLPPRPRKSPGNPKEYELVWISRILSVDGWQPGAYGVECSYNGKKFVNSTYDVR